VRESKQVNLRCAACGCDAFWCDGDEAWCQSCCEITCVKVEYAALATLQRKLDAAEERVRVLEAALIEFANQDNTKEKP